MDRITELSNAILMLIRVGAVFRIAFIFFGMISNEDEVAAGKKRVKNTLMSYVIAELAFVLKNIIMTYYS